LKPGVLGLTDLAIAQSGQQLLQFLTDLGAHAQLLCFVRSSTNIPASRAKVPGAFEIDSGFVRECRPWECVE
jgi:hypothetical protein